MRTIRRWAVVQPPLAGRGGALAARIEFRDGTYLVECEFGAFGDARRQLRSFQTSLQPGEFMLPSLTAPTERLPQAVLDWLANRGVVPQPGDTVLNLLRALRDAMKDSMGLDFDVDLEQ